MLCAAEMSRKSEMLALAWLLKLTGRVMLVHNDVVGARHYTGKETVWCLQQFSPGAPAG